MATPSILPNNQTQSGALTKVRPDSIGTGTGGPAPPVQSGFLYVWR